MEEIRVDGWTELQERLFDEAWRPEIGRFRSNYAFRGRADAAEDLRSSLIRLGRDTRNVEGYLLRNFRSTPGAATFRSIPAGTGSPSANTMGFPPDC